MEHFHQSSLTLTIDFCRTILSNPLFIHDALGDGLVEVAARCQGEVGREESVLIYQVCTATTSVDAGLKSTTLT
jgi:hypothetical protein